MLHIFRAGLKSASSFSLSGSQRRSISRGLPLLTKHKQRQQRWGQRLKEDQQRKNGEGLPFFMALMRQIYKKVHPDLLRSSYPDLAKVNDESMQLINGVLSTIKNFGEYPPQIIKTIPFHMLDGQGGTRLVSLHIQTAGGECKRQLTECFALFFRETGVLTTDNDSFRWDKEYFPTTGNTQDLKQGKEEASESVIRV